MKPVLMFSSAPKNPAFRPYIIPNEPTLCRRASSYTPYSILLEDWKVSPPGFICPRMGPSCFARSSQSQRQSTMVEK